MLLLLQCLRPLAQVDTVCWARLTAVATNWPLTCSVAHLLSWRVALLRQSDRQLVTRCCCCWLPVCSGQPVHSSSSSSSLDETLSSSQFSICRANQINWWCLFTVHLDMTSCLLPNCFAGVCLVGALSFPCDDLCWPSFLWFFVCFCSLNSA